jgi:hypothetical protein
MPQLQLIEFSNVGLLTLLFLTIKTEDTDAIPQTEFDSWDITKEILRRMK